MSAIQRWLSVRYGYANLVDRQRANGLLRLTAGLTLIWLVYNVIFVILGVTTGSPLSAGTVVLALLPMLSVAIYFLLQSGRLRLASWLFLTALFLGTGVFSFVPFDYSLPVLLIVPLATAGVLLNRRDFVVVFLITVIVLIVRSLLLSSVEQTITVDVSAKALIDFGNMFWAVALTTLSLYTFSISNDDVSTISEADIEHFKIVSGFYASDDEEALLANALRMIQKDLGYDSAQLFLVNNDGTTQRRLRLGANGTELIPSNIVNAGNATILRQVIDSRQAVMVGIEDEQERRLHLNAGSQQSLSIPVVNLGTVLAVLDVQNDDAGAFSSNHVEALRLFGQRLGAALWKARLVTDLRQSLREREDAATYMSSQLAEMQGRGRHILLSGWGKYLQTRGELFGYDLPNRGGTIIPAAELTPELRAAMRRGDVFVETLGSEQIINAPIVFRGEVLGAMSFAISAEQAVGERELELVRTVTNRLGIALENNRLLEQTQAQARRERKASEVANVLLGATSIESLMELAADNFNEALDAIYTRIYLEPGIGADAPEVRGELA